MKSYKKYICELLDVCKSLKIITSYKIHKSVTKRDYYISVIFGPGKLLVYRSGNTDKIKISGIDNEPIMISTKELFPKFKIAILFIALFPTTFVVSMKRIAFIIQSIQAMR